MVTKAEAKQIRWRFLLGGLVVSLGVRISNFVNSNEPATPEIIGSFFGAAMGGALLGWLVWWIWSLGKR
jgi:hypothetical protein